MKKYISILLALVFCLSLLPLGALASEDPAADGEPEEAPIDEAEPSDVPADGDDLILEVTSQEELTDALNRTEPVAEIRIMKAFTVTEESLVLYDEAHYPNYRETSLIIHEGVTLTIGAGGAVGLQAPSFWDWTREMKDDEKPAQPSGRMVNNGTIIVEEGGNAGFSFEENNGEVIVNAGGEFRIPETNNGTVTVKRGGALRTSQGNDCHNNGEITIEQGAELDVRMGSNLKNHSHLTVNGIFTFGCFDDGAWFDPADGKVDGCGYLAAVDVMSPDAPGDGVKAFASQLGETLMEGTDLRVGYFVSVADYDALTAAFPAGGEEENGNRYVIAQVVEDLTVTGELGALGSVIVPAGVTVTIADGAELGTGLYSKGTIVVETGGTLATTMGGSNALVSDGALIVKEGAELISRMGGSVVNRGDMTLDGTFTCGALSYPDETGLVTDHVWFRNEGTVTGGGTIELNDMGLQDREGTTAAVQAALGENSDVTVKIGGGSGEPGGPVEALRAYLRDPEGHFAKGFDTDRDGKLNEDEIIAAVDEFHSGLDAGDAILLLRCGLPMACVKLLQHLVGIVLAA